MNQSATGHSHPNLLRDGNNYRGLLMEMGRSREEAVDILRDLAPELFR